MAATPTIERGGQAIVFQGWEGGEYGLLEPGMDRAARQSFSAFDQLGSSRAAPQHFTAKNCLLYTSGYMGPRPGLKKVTIASMPTGIIKGMEAAVPATGTGPWFWVGIGATTACNFYLVDVGAGTVSTAYTGGGVPLTVNAPIPRGSSFGNGEFLNVYIQGLYVANHDLKTLTKFLAGQTGGYVSSAWRQRFLATDNSQGGGQGSNRMFFSDVQNDPLTDTWPLINFYDVGSVGAISFIRPFRDGIMIGKQDGTMWYMTGVLGSAANLKQLSSGGAPINESRAVMMDSDIVYYMRYSSPYLSSFNGSVHTDFKALQFTGGDFANDSSVHVGWPAFRMETLPWLGTDSFMTISGLSTTNGLNRMMMRDNGVFTYHTFEQNVDPWVASMGSILPSTRGIDTLSNSPYVMIAHGADGSYYKFAPGLDRPAFTADANAQPGDNSTTPIDAYLKTPEWWSGDAHQIRVLQVIVDYRAWSTGSGTANGFTVQVDALHRDGSAATTVGTPRAAPNVPTGSTTGVDVRAVVNVDAGTGRGGGFQVTIGSMAGIAVRTITVVLANKLERP